MTARVWEHSKQAGSGLLLLLALADQSNDAGISWPSVGSLSRKTRLSEREVQYLIGQIVASGELVVARGGGRGHSSVYQIRVHGLHPSASMPTETVQYLHPLQSQDSPNGAIPSDIPDPSPGTVQSSAPFSEERVQSVQPLHPLGEIKGAKLGERVQSSARKGAKIDVKGAAGCTRTVLTVLTEPSLRTETTRTHVRARDEIFSETKKTVHDRDDYRPPSSPCGECGTPIPLGPDWSAFCSEACRARARPRARVPVGA